MSEIIIISEGTKHRELIEVTTLSNKKKTSKTFHQTKINERWIDNKRLKPKTIVKYNN